MNSVEVGQTSFEMPPTEGISIEHYRTVAEFLTEPLDKQGETRCYIRDPDGYLIEVGQSKPGVKYG